LVIESPELSLDAPSIAHAELKTKIS